MTENELGKDVVHDLKPDGRSIAVTDANKVGAPGRVWCARLCTQRPPRRASTWSF
jgi:hypothetical protein